MLLFARFARSSPNGESATAPVDFFLNNGRQTDSGDGGLELTYSQYYRGAVIYSGVLTNLSELATLTFLRLMPIRRSCSVKFLRMALEGFNLAFRL